MKKTIVSTAFIVFLGACSDGKLDESKLDAAGDKLQKAVEKGADSLVSKADRLKDSLKKDRDTGR